MDHNEHVLGADAADALAAHLHDHPRLNESQRLVFEHDMGRTVQLVHGPPGTGKTSVIDSYLQSPARKSPWLKGACERHVVLVVSEKNHAVNAIAASLLSRGGGESGGVVWEETIAQGVVKSLGTNTKQFLVQEKANNDPSVRIADQEVDAADAARITALSNLGDIVNSHKDSIIVAAETAKATWEDVTLDPDDKTRFSSAADACRKHAGDPETLAQILCDVLSTTAVAATVGRSIDLIEHQRQAVVEAKGEYGIKVIERVAVLKSAVTRLRQNAKVVLSTLGSSHRMMSALEQKVPDDANDVTAKRAKKGKGADTSVTIVCDEASTVHSALFIGAVARLSAKVKIINILVIGDDRQLPPYWPLREPELLPTALYTLAANVTPATKLVQQYRMPKFVMDVLNNHFYSDTPLVYAKVLNAYLDEKRPIWIDVRCDISASTVDGQGWRWSTSPGTRAVLQAGGEQRPREPPLSKQQPQPRHPKAKGAVDTPVPPQPLPVDASDGDSSTDIDHKQSEESRDEAEMVIQEARRALESAQSVLIITPYQRQRSLIARMVHSSGLNAFTEDGRLVVATVDGGQGQEADVLIISLVKPRPSKFLDAKRVCVMLSRGRRRLVIVGNHPTHLQKQNRCKPLAEIARLSKVARPAKLIALDASTERKKK